jgi:hypothetical protein
MFTVDWLLIISSIVLAILSAVRPYPVLWVAVLLLGILEALVHLPTH